MALPWPQTPEAKSFLDNLDPSALSIKAIAVRDPAGLGQSIRYVWLPSDMLEKTLDKIIDKQVDIEAGVTFAEAELGPQRDRWVELYEQQQTINQVLIEKFGDPDILRMQGKTLRQARQIHKDSPGYVTRHRDMLVRAAVI